MPSKTFKSPFGWFSLKLPKDWDEYEDEEGTCAFFNTKSWTGNLRISAIRIDNNNIDEYLQTRLSEKGNASQIFLAGKQCIFYVEKIQKDGLVETLYWWLMGTKNFLFVCSYTINEDFEFNGKKDKELNTVTEIISSITIN